MIPIKKAVEMVAAAVRPLETEEVGIRGAVGRVLAEDVRADSDLPPFDRSQMDGYAVKAADTKHAPVLLKVAGESAAGAGWHHRLKSGQAVRIMTGAPIPRGADAVQKVELTLEVGDSPFMESDSVTILEPTIEGRYVVERGHEVKKGSVVLAAGERITPEKIAVLAAFGRERVRVGRRPRLAVLATGSEIVDISQRPGRDQIRNSNSPTVAALAERFGCEVNVLPIAKDDLSELKAEIASAAGSSDVLVITGGVSVGKYDLTKSALAQLGAKIHFEKIRLKPGKPTVFAELGQTLVFGLPGNPVSVAVTFHIFVRLALLSMQGQADTALESGFAIAGKRVKGTKERDSYLPATVRTDRSGRLIADPIAWHGSSDLIGFSRARVLIVVPRRKTFEKGDVAPFVFI